MECLFSQCCWQGIHPSCLKKGAAGCKTWRPRNQPPQRDDIYSRPRTRLHSQSGEEGTRGVPLAQYCLPYSFLCCFLTPLAIKAVVCTYTAEVAETLSPCTASSQDLKRHSLQMTLLSAHILRMLDGAPFSVSHVKWEFGLTRSLQKTSFVAQDPSHFYFRSSSLSLGTELNT